MIGFNVSIVVVMLMLCSWLVVVLVIVIEVGLFVVILMISVNCLLFLLIWLWMIFGGLVFIDVVVELGIDGVGDIDVLVLIWNFDVFSRFSVVVLFIVGGVVGI